jgi:hypothetical protein
MENEKEPEKVIGGTGIEKLESEEMKSIATGIKSRVENSTAIKEANEGKKPEDNFEYPSLFIKEDARVKIFVDILFEPDTGKPVLMMIVKEDSKENPLSYLKRRREYCEFTIPNYDNMVVYRENSMTYDKDIRQHIVDPIKLRLHYIRYNLKDWSLQENGKKIELTFKNTLLSDESMNKILTMSASLMDLFLSEFERETLLA